MMNTLLIASMIVLSQMPMRGRLTDDGVMHAQGFEALEADRFIGDVSATAVSVTTLSATYIYDASGQVIGGYNYDYWVVPADVNEVTYALPVGTHKLTDVMLSLLDKTYPWKRGVPSESGVVPTVGDWWGADGGIRLQLNTSLDAPATAEIRYAWTIAEAPAKVCPYGGNTGKTIKAPLYFSGMKVGFGL